MTVSVAWGSPIVVGHVVVVVVLAISATSHVVKVERFADEIEMHAILPGGPRGWAVAVASLELILAVGACAALYWGYAPVALLAAGSFMGLVSVYAGRAVRRRVDPECGCGLTESLMGLSTVIRATVVALIALVTAAASVSVSAFSFDLGERIIVSAAGASLALLIASVGNGPLNAASR